MERLVQWSSLACNEAAPLDVWFWGMTLFQIVLERLFFYYLFRKSVWDVLVSLPEWIPALWGVLLQWAPCSQAFLSSSFRILKLASWLALPWTRFCQELLKIDTMSFSGVGCSGWTEEELTESHLLKVLERFNRVWMMKCSRLGEVWACESTVTLTRIKRLSIGYPYMRHIKS